MSREGVKQLMDLWINDPSFRDQVKQDPEGAVGKAGVQLDEEEWAAIRSTDWSVPDEELSARASKATPA